MQPSTALAQFDVVVGIQLRRQQWAFGMMARQFAMTQELYCSVLGGAVAAALAIGLMSSASAESPTQPSSAACFDIIGALSVAANGAILLNRCTGQSWALIRSRGRRGDAGFRWAPIAMENGETAASASVPPEDRPHSHPAAQPQSDKCFTFNGRQFCE